VEAMATSVYSTLRALVNEILSSNISRVLLVKLQNTAPNDVNEPPVNVSQRGVYGWEGNNTDSTHVSMTTWLLEKVQLSLCISSTLQP
jgi:hypothetical protein